MFKIRLKKLVENPLNSKHYNRNIKFKLLSHEPISFYFMFNLLRPASVFENFYWVSAVLSTPTFQ